jgi:glutamyl-tRNA reductase
VVSIVVVGVNHKSVPVDLLERLAISEEMLPKALHQLSTYEHVLEGAILSTCNRIEAYAVVSKFHGGAQDLRNFFAEFCHVAPEEFTDRLYTYHDEAAVGHLFKVAAGIDSMVIGESEILGQVRRAFAGASAEGTVQRTLSHVFRQALRVGKRARTETSISRNPVSISSAAVELARSTFPERSLEGLSVLVVGAGKMGRLAMQALRNAGTSSVTLVNRSEERALAVADEFGVLRRRFEELEDAIAESDIVISSTTAPDAVISRPIIERVVAQRSKQVFIVDIAVPRDVDPEVRQMQDVVLRDIDDLRGVVESGVGSRLGEVSKVEDLVAQELQRFLDWQRASEIGPTLAALVDKAEAIRLAELNRMAPRLEGLSSEQRQAVDEATRRAVAKLLHAPMTKARELAGLKDGHSYIAALRELFELDDDGDE